MARCALGRAKNKRLNATLRLTPVKCLYIRPTKYEIKMDFVVDKRLAIAAAAQLVVLQVIDEANARDATLLFLT